MKVSFLVQQRRHDSPIFSHASDRLVRKRRRENEQYVEKLTERKKGIRLLA